MTLVEKQFATPKPKQRHPSWMVATLNATGTSCQASAMISTTRGKHNLAAVEFKKARRVLRARTSAGVTAYS